MTKIAYIYGISMVVLVKKRKAVIIYVLRKTSMTIVVLNLLSIFGVREKFFCLCRIIMEVTQAPSWSKR